MPRPIRPTNAVKPILRNLLQKHKEDERLSPGDNHGQFIADIIDETCVSLRAALYSDEQRQYITADFVKPLILSEIDSWRLPEDITESCLHGIERHEALRFIDVTLTEERERGPYSSQ